MPVDPAPSQIATNALQSIPFSAMIGGPLKSAIEAQAMAAQTSWNFIQQVGLQTDKATGETKAVTVTFQYQKNGQMVNLIVPLLAIVPIPYIAIDTITIDFMAKIDASSSTYSEQSSSSEKSGKLSGSMKIGWGIFSATVNFSGGISSKSSSKATEESKYSVEYTINIHVEAGQDSMPAGLATVLNMLNSAISEADPKGTLEISPAACTIEKGADTATISYKARDGSDLAVTKDVVFTISIPETGAPQMSGSEGKAEAIKTSDFKLSCLTGTSKTAAAGTITVTPDAQGVASIAVSLSDPTNVATSGVVNCTLTGGAIPDAAGKVIPVNVYAA